MADYPQLAATLVALNGTKENPSDVEDASKLAAALRQTRTWAYDFLATIVDEGTGRLKSSAVGESSIPEGGIRGSIANDGTPREILQGTVSTPDLRNLAVSTEKIADEAVTADKIAEGGVTTSRLADNAVLATKIDDSAVTTDKLANAAVTAPKIANGAVETAKLADGAVTSTKIGTNGIDGSNLPVASGGQVLLHNGVKFVPTTLTGAIAVSSAGVATLSITGTSTSSIRVSERTASGTSAGASSAASWAQKRGVTTPWTIDESLGSSFLTIGAAGALNIIANGAFLVMVRVPAYSVGGHKVKATYTPVSGSSTDYHSESAQAGAGSTTTCAMSFVLSVTGASSGSPASLVLAHWTERAEVAGLGLAASSGEVERYATLEILRLTSA